MNENTKKEIEDLVGGNEVVLFMKGRRRMPQCGFSANVVQVLDQLVDEYVTVNVLDRQDIRQGIKEFSEWPTIPQLYVKGQFIGGADIVNQMFASGDLHKALGVEMKEVAPPKVTVTDAAKKAFEGALSENPGAMVRFEVDARFRPGLDLDSPKGMDFQVESNGLTVLVSRMSAERANGVTIDFVEGDAGGFKIDNPNEPPKVRHLQAKELQSRLQSGEAIHLIDVRTPEEAELARIEGARLYDEATAQWIATLPKDTPLVFQCHSGQRSMAAAENYLKQGYTKVYNLSGGIDAWSREVDPKVPRY